MDNTELSVLVAEKAKSDPRSREGIEAVFALEKILAGEPEFSKPRMIVSGRGGHGWLPQFAAQTMLTIARSGRGADAAVSWLRKAPSVTRGIGGAVKALYGVQCAQRINVSDDIVLMPFSDVPQSTIRDWIVTEHERANDFSLVHGFTAGPSAALYRAGTVEPLFVDAPGDLHKSAPSTWFGDLDDAARLLALIPKAIPIEAAHWFHYDDPDVAMLGQFGLSRQGPELRPIMAGAPVDVAAADVAGIFAAYKKLKESDKGRVNLALERIMRSRCQFVSGNRAIDIAIALEVLFMNVDRDEHSYKISLRAARLLHKDLKTRRRTFLEVKRLCDMRSSMVHSGSVKNEYRLDGVSVPAHELVEVVDVICTEAIRAFLSMGDIPDDWRDIELCADGVQR